MMSESIPMATIPWRNAAVAAACGELLSPILNVLYERVFMSLFNRLWSDDDGAIISVEMILIIAILLFGIIPGLVAMRNSINAAFGTIGNILVRIVPSFTFSGWEYFATPGGGSTIALVQGFQSDGNQSSELAALQVIPYDLGSSVAIPPAP